MRQGVLLSQSKNYCLCFYYFLERSPIDNADEFQHEFLHCIMINQFYKILQAYPDGC